MVDGGNSDSNDVSKSKSDALTAMSEEEMSQHLALCLKLNAENKINAKNAFGLHLIDILSHKVNKDTQDLQSASLSLQASSKIYASRVDALYQDTFTFHNQLQTIALNKKVEDKQHNDDGDEVEKPKEKRKTQGKKSFIVSEESVFLKTESTCRNKMPHANFITIKSAFAASRTTPKLLERIPVANDSCKLFGTTSLPCFIPKTSMPVVDFSYPTKRKGLLQKVQNVDLPFAESESATLCSDVFYPALPKSPAVAPDMDAPSDDSFIIGSSPVPEQQDADVEDIIDKFSVMDITADVLVEDLRNAIVDANTVDRNRLPPGSALKKVIRTADKSTVGKKAVRFRVERPLKEPFFSQQRTVDASILLKKGRKIILTEKDISKWKMEDTTMKSKGPELFSTLFADAHDDPVHNENILKTVHELMQENMAQYFEGYFCKESWWKKYGKQRNARLIRPSSFGVCLNNNDSKGNASEISSSVVVQLPFQNLSLENSPSRSDDYDGDNWAPPDACDLSLALEAPVHPFKSSVFEDDLKSVLVTPPEMPQPVIIKVETKPITLSTIKLKMAIWDIVKKGDVLLFKLHEELKKVFEGEYLPLQYVFTTLLVVANEKCLVLENVEAGDIKITEDVPE